MLLVLHREVSRLTSSTIAFLTSLCEWWNNIGNGFSVAVFVVAVGHCYFRPLAKPRCIGHCRHESCAYDCFPPYTAPGGLRQLVTKRRACLLDFVPYWLLHWRKHFAEMYHHRRNSFSSDEGSHLSISHEPLPPAVLVYHESARSIVFRDHVRRANKNDTPRQNSDNALAPIANVQPVIQPLPSLELGPQDQFQSLIDEGSDSSTWNEAEQEVVSLLKEQHAVVKTLKNSDWTAFLHRFQHAHEPHYRRPHAHDDIGPHEGYNFNSFVTSTTLLPELGKKMRCYGSLNDYSTGVVFALPSDPSEDETVARSQTWAWPSGYSAKTEFNIDGSGNLINGREEALVTLSTLRKQNHDYVYEKDYSKCICG